MTQVTTALEESALADLREAFRGELIRPGEDGYQEHRRVWNGSIFNDENPDRVREAYGERRFARLQALKCEHDPDNVFRLNENVPPEEPGS